MDFVVSEKPATLSYFALVNYIYADMDLFYLPNALSHHAPDGDDRAIKVFGEVFEEKGFSFVVSNQWGNVVYKTTSFAEMTSR